MTAQNRSTAVMQRRCVAPDELDDFPTQPWATRAMLAWLRSQGHVLSEQTCREPAANRGHMVRPLREAFAAVDASDVFDYGHGFAIRDYLFGADLEPVDWTITNPPFRLAQAFIERALATSRVGVVMVLRTAFLEGEDRYETLFRDLPPDYVLVSSQRIVMLRGRLIRAGAIDPFAAKQGTKASSATSYCWFVWLTDGDRDTRVRWIPPCRAEMEREGDYPVYDLFLISDPDSTLF